MIQVEFKPNEMDILISFLDRLSDYLSSEGCNDCEMLDTPENRALIEEAEASGKNLTVEEWRQHNDYREHKSYHGRVTTYDFELLGFLKKRLKKAQESAKQG